MTLSSEAQAIAEAQAARDRDLLASLVKSGRVRRTGARSSFSRDIERRVQALDGRNLAIRPKKAKRKKR